jgi:N utilization substance protein A
MYQMSTGARTGKDAVGQDVVTTIRQMARERGLDLEALLGALEEALTAAERRARGGDEGVRVSLGRETGEILVLERDPGAEGGWRPAGSRVGLGRVAAQAVRQAIRDGIRRREREAAVREYGGRIGETVVGVVSRPGPGSVLLDLGRAEGIIPAAEQVPGERHRRGERLRAVVVDVRPGGEGPEVALSRRSEALVADLLRLEVPAVEDGLVEVRAIAREPGVRTKISVAARRPGVDPVGACIGPRGARIRRVVAELGGERVDVLRHEDEPARLVARAGAGTGPRGPGRRRGSGGDGDRAGRRDRGRRGAERRECALGLASGRPPREDRSRLGARRRVAGGPRGDRRRALRGDSRERAALRERGHLRHRVLQPAGPRRSGLVRGLRLGAETGAAAAGAPRAGRASG